MTIVFLRPPVVKSSRLVRADSIASVVLDDPSRPFLHGAIVVSGRVPDPHVADEVAIDEVAARGGDGGLVTGCSSVSRRPMMHSEDRGLPTHRPTSRVSRCV